MQVFVATLNGYQRSAEVEADFFVASAEGITFYEGDLGTGAVPVAFHANVLSVRTKKVPPLSEALERMNKAEAEASRYKEILRDLIDDSKQAEERLDELTEEGGAQ